MLKAVILFVIYVSCVRSVTLFPENFLFGVASSAYQVEGAWNISGKGENIFDYHLHNNITPSVDLSNGDVSCDSYHLLHEDIKLLRDLGVNSYRFSLSWTRILPTGFASHVNPDGIRYYNELIDELLKYNITPIVTLSHWDLPVEFSFLGGWTNPVMVDYFQDFVDVAFQYFGDRVKLWTTFNEPLLTCSPMFLLSYFTVNGSTEAVAPYLCGHTILKSHSKAYHLLKNKYKDQKGKIGIVLDPQLSIPLSDDIEDKNAAFRSMEYDLHWLAHPIFSQNGDYPRFLKEHLGAISEYEEFPRSKLPEFTPDEIREIQGSADFLAINHYSSKYCTPGKFLPDDKPSFEKDKNVETSPDKDWEESEIGWYSHPEGMYEILMLIENFYNHTPLVVTENGFADSPINDVKRQRYLQGYLGNLSKAIQDGANVFGYYVWSLMDSYEWYHGYTAKLGLYQVDFTKPSLPRTPRNSAIWYKNLIKEHKESINYRRILLEKQEL